MFQPDFEMENPFKQPARRCILCQTDVELDYKVSQSIEIRFIMKLNDKNNCFPFLDFSVLVIVTVRDA